MGGFGPLRRGTEAAGAGLVAAGPVAGPVIAGSGSLRVTEAADGREGGGGLAGSGGAIGVAVCGFWPVIPPLVGAGSMDSELGTSRGLSTLGASRVGSETVGGGGGGATA